MPARLISTPLTALTQYGVGNGNGWVNLDPMPDGWKSSAAPGKPGKFRLKVFTDWEGKFSLGFSDGEDRRVIEGSGSIEVIEDLSPSRRFYVRGIPTGEPVHVVIEELRL